MKSGKQVLIIGIIAGLVVLLAAGLAIAAPTWAGESQSAGADLGASAAGSGDQDQARQRDQLTKGECDGTCDAEQAQDRVRKQDQDRTEDCENCDGTCEPAGDETKARVRGAEAGPTGGSDGGAAAQNRNGASEQGAGRNQAAGNGACDGSGDGSGTCDNEPVGSANQHGRSK